MKENIILEYPDRMFGLALILSYSLTFSIGKLEIKDNPSIIAFVIMIILLSICMIKIYYKLGIFKKKNLK